MNREVEVRLKFRVDRDENLYKYFVTVTANVVGRPHDTLEERMELSDDVIENGFSGKKDVALDLFKKEAINDIIWKLLEELKKKDRMLFERLVMLYYTIVEEFKPSRHLLYILQDFRGRFSFCPCGFFCPECLIMEVCFSGPFKGILNHVFYHSLLGTIYFRLKEKETEAMIL